MERGLSRKLRQGRPVLNGDLSVSVLGQDGQIIHRLHASSFVGGGMGYFFERIVCLHYSHLGFAVEERSCLGYNDRGIDLVADRAGERVFVQCKFTFAPISPKRIEEVLFAASAFVRANRCSGANYFDLVVPSLELAFPPRRPRRRVTAQQAFLRHNDLQNAVKLRLVEVPVDVPDLIELRQFSADDAGEGSDGV